ncbi:MAG: rfaG [Gammaproteobacteria bacterium]|jgi:UDP-glucose:(heptosyl)LPS alpha-1,3-glucosyltransferase|nr:rfaG [Gammaproteobacteria bacterium]
MKLALCIFKYFPFGGAQRDMLKFSQLALQQGHEVICYTTSWQGEIPAGLEVKLLPVKAFSNHQRVKKFIYLLHQALTKDPVVSIGFSRLPGLDYYFACDLCLRKEAARKHPWLYRWLPRYRSYLAIEKQIFEPCAKTQILLLNESQQAIYQQYYQTQDEKFHRISAGIKLPDMPLAKEDARLQLNLSFCEKKVKWLLMVGHNLKLKGIERDLRALAALPKHILEDVYFLVVGEQRKTYFAKMAEKLGIAEHVCFLGSRKDVYTLMQASDIFLHAAYHDTTGTVIAEALANGLPVLVTDTCGYASYVRQSGAGKVISGQPFQQGVYNQALLESLADLPNEHWQKSARGYMQQQDQTSIAEQILKVITKTPGVVSE